MSLCDQKKKKKKNDIWSIDRYYWNIEWNIYNMTKDYWEEIIRFDSYLLLGQWIWALMAVVERIGEKWSASDGIEQSEAH